MKPVKDNFSALAAIYAKFRPVYPADLYAFLRSKAPALHAAWDCGTGNGQVAVALAQFFDRVTATDISQQQMDAAPARDNISYIACRAEQTNFADDSFDLITVAQAIHWFDFDSFYREAARVARHGALLAVWTYNVCRIDKATDQIVDHFYKEIVGPYWDKERRYVDEAYRTIPFSFEEISTPPLEIQDSWTADQLKGYLSSWSATAHYQKQNGRNPLELIVQDLDRIWPQGLQKQVRFPVYMRAGYIQK